MSIEVRVKGAGLHAYDLVKKRIIPNPNKKVLDVGGFGDNPVFSTVSVNISPSHSGLLPTIYADGRALPFKDNSFPSTTSVDVLGSIPGNGHTHYTSDEIYRERLQFIAEQVRVAQESVVMTTPFFSAANEEAEKALLNQIESLLLTPRRSLIKHEKLGLPTIEDLVRLGRDVRQPFHVYPGTNRTALFQFLHDQADIISSVKGKKSSISQLLERIQARAIEGLNASLPTWEEAYRAIMVIRKNQPGKLIIDEDQLFLANNEVMAYQAALGKAGFSNIPNSAIFDIFRNFPLRGRTINVEGPEGSGKTRLVRALQAYLQQWGYTVATQTNHGRRQWMRDMEQTFEMVISDPERAEFFLFAMWEAAIAGNAFTLQGPCFVNISDRSMASVQMHHALHTPYNRSIPYTLNERDPLQISPDLTIMMWVEDPNDNFRLMQKDGDLVNSTKGPAHLEFQRKWYERLYNEGGNIYTGKIHKLVNPGVDGSFGDVLAEALEAIENTTGIPTTH